MIVGTFSHAVIGVIYTVLSQFISFNFVVCSLKPFTFTLTVLPGTSVGSFPSSKVTVPLLSTVPSEALPSSVVTVTFVPASGFSPVIGVTEITGFLHDSGGILLLITVSSAAHSPALTVNFFAGAL